MHLNGALCFHAVALKVLFLLKIRIDSLQEMALNGTEEVATTTDVIVSWINLWTKWISIQSISHQQRQKTPQKLGNIRHNSPGVGAPNSPNKQRRWVWSGNDMNFWGQELSPGGYVWDVHSVSWFLLSIFEVCVSVSPFLLQLLVPSFAPRDLRGPGCLMIFPDVNFRSEMNFLEAWAAIVDDTVDGWNPKANHLGWCWNPINNGKNYLPQLVQDFSHQQ